MIDVLMTTTVVLFLAFVTALIASRTQRELRPWVWVGLLEYMLCCLYQYFHGADANGYRQVGTLLARALDANFAWASRELIALMIHAPSAFDDLDIGVGTNTASMCAASAFIIFFVRGSGAAAQALVAGLAFFGALGVHRAFRDAWPTAKPFHLFLATVLFPSIAFWVSALHKEAFCLMGMGLSLMAWRALYRGNVLSAILLGLPGLMLIASFRPPVLAPLFLGMAVHFAQDRIQRQGRRASTAARAFYLAIATLIFAFGALLIGRIAPEFGIEKISESITKQQSNWQQIADEGLEGGSSFGTDEIVQSIPQQIASAPLALVNALLRPQFFDVRNAVQFVSAVEMTAITIILIMGFKRLGFRGVVRRVRGSPFFLMCAIITVVGATFIGITTRNFGTLARYRVPFLPFYGVVLSGLLERRARAPGSSSDPASAVLVPRLRAPMRRRAGGATGLVRSNDR